MRTLQQRARLQQSSEQREAGAHRRGPPKLTVPAQMFLKETTACRETKRSLNCKEEVNLLENHKMKFRSVLLFKSANEEQIEPTAAVGGREL